MRFFTCSFSQLGRQLQTRLSLGGSVFSSLRQRSDPSLERGRVGDVSVEAMPRNDRLVAAAGTPRIDLHGHRKAANPGRKSDFAHLHVKRVGTRLTADRNRTETGPQVDCVEAGGHAGEIGKDVDGAGSSYCRAMHAS